MRKVRKGKKQISNKKIGHNNKGKDYTDYPLGGGDYVRVYKPDPIDEILGLGGKVSFVHKKKRR
jgi:hypothetical protein